MYTIYADGVCIYNDIFTLDNMKIINPKLSLGDSAAGSLTITLPPTNIGYKRILRMASDISVEKDNKEIWSGRVLSEEMDFWNNRTLHCEGELAFLNDSSQPPHEYVNLTVRGYLEALLEVHNSKVAVNRRFSVGAVTVHDDTFPARYTNHEKTMELVNGLVEQYGGHIQIRKENGVRYIDFLARYPDTCSQTIQFGRNLVEFTRQWDATEFATVVIPLGARLDDSPIEALDAYLTVESVNGGCMYVQSDAAVEAYGWIEKVVIWSDVSDPAVLLEKAKAYLADLQFDNMEIELSALDLHYLDANIEAVKLLDEIQVISLPHGMNRLFPVTKLEIPLDNPEKTVFTLGQTVKTSLTSVNNQTNSEILQKIAKLPKAHSILKEAKENATHIMEMATTGYVSIVKDEYGSESLVISNTRDWKDSSKYWLWNMNGLAYFDKKSPMLNADGSLKLAITMDGAIVADFITVGTMSADRVRTGLLTDIYGNVKFDLDTGTLTMKKGSIDIGNGTFKVDTDGNLTMKKGSINIGNGAFEVDSDGNLTATKGTFAGKLVAATGTFGGELQAATGNFKGSLDIGTGSFTVDANGNVKITKGSIDISNGAFRVTSAGNVTMTKGSINIASGAFKVDSTGTLTMTKGSIDIGNGTFKVDALGNLTASKGTFKGIVQALDFRDAFGDSMLTSGKFKADYLSLYGLTITNQSTRQTSFQVSSTGAVTINGKVTMGSGSSINWASVTNSNLRSNPAYSLANSADTKADRAQSRADDAYDEASAAYSRANSAYRLANSIEMPSYIKSTYIDSTTIQSPVIEGGEFYGSEFNIIAGSDYGSLNLYGPYGSSRYHMFTIEYYEGDAPRINLYSPCGGYMSIGSSYMGIVYFDGVVDFSNATVRGLDTGGDS